MIVIHRKITWLLLFSVISLFIASWLIYVSKRNLERTSARINQTHEIISMIRQIGFTVSQPSPQLELQQYTDSLQRLTSEYKDLRPQRDTLRQYLLHPPTKARNDSVSRLLSLMMQKEKTLVPRTRRRTMPTTVNRQALSRPGS